MIGIGAAFRAGAAASQRQFSTTAAAEQAQFFDARLTEFNQGLAGQFDAQKQYMGTIENRVRNLEQKLEEAIDTISNLVARLDMIPQVLGDANRSAGGPIGRTNENDQPALGLFAATGDLRWSSNMSDFAPPGWLVCDGAELEIDGYYDLFLVIGQHYGPADDPVAHFKLPEPADVTQDADTLSLVNAGKLRLLIRT